MRWRLRRVSLRRPGRHSRRPPRARCGWGSWGFSWGDQAVTRTRNRRVVLLPAASVATTVTVAVAPPRFFFRRLSAEAGALRTSRVRLPAPTLRVTLRSFTPRAFTFAVTLTVDASSALVTISTPARRLSFCRLLTDVLTTGPATSRGALTGWTGGLVGTAGGAGTCGCSTTGGS